ncbi:hypothetical protein [Sinorhizobium fredii]|uniref:hypothetical protein n=1 Tax=Rhizobium fredii TaxID=380 RepID=UPI0035122B04
MTTAPVQRKLGKSLCAVAIPDIFWSEIHRLYRLTARADTSRNDIEPSFNIAPMQPVPFITTGDDGHKVREGR